MAAPTPIHARAFRLLFARTLKNRRLELDLTQAEVAERLGIPPNTYGFWERGEAGISAEYLPVIAKALDCSVVWLVCQQELQQAATLGLYESLPPAYQAAVMAVIRTLDEQARK